MKQVKIPHTFKNSPSKEWMNFLLLVTDTQKNKNLALEYFSKEFCLDMGNVVHFLNNLEKFFKSPEPDFEEKKDIAKKYLKIIAPLCERFNFYNERNQLDDIGFEIINPIEHKKVKDRLFKYKLDAEDLTPQILQNLRKIIKIEGFKCKVSGRYKNIYSVYQKLQKQEYKSILDLNDIFAFRIILDGNKKEECFEIVNKLHDYFTPIPQLFKDYISIPKINGYQSLHTGLSDIITKRNIPVEIQIRTSGMHDMAENGVAAHWNYAQEKKSQLVTEKERKLICHYGQVASHQNCIFCFALNGGIIKLPKNSTVLDFATKIHTNLAKHATGALINNLPTKLNQTLHDGDFVEILK